MIKPNKIIIGRDKDRNDFEINFDEKCHALIGGLEGSGKTVFLHTLITEILKSNEKAMILVINYDPDEYRIFANLERVMIIKPDADSIIGSLFTTIKLEQEGFKNDFYIVIDEIRDFEELKYNDVLNIYDFVDRINENNDNRNFHLVITSRDFNFIDDLGHDNITDSMSFLFLFPSMNLLRRGKKEPETIEVNPGICIYEPWRKAKELKYIKINMLSNEEIEATTDSLKHSDY